MPEPTPHHHHHDEPSAGILHRPLSTLKDVSSQEDLIRKYDEHVVTTSSKDGNNKKRFVPLHLFNTSTERVDTDLLVNTKLLQLERDIAKNLSTTTKVQSCNWWRRNNKGIMRLVYNDFCDEALNLVIYNPLEDQSRFVDCGEIVLSKKEKDAIEKKKKRYKQYQPKPPRRLLLEIPPRSFRILNKTCLLMSSSTTSRGGVDETSSTTQNHHPRIHLFPANPRLPTPGMKLTASWDDERGGVDPPPIRVSATKATNYVGMKSFSKFGCDVNCERNDVHANVNDKVVDHRWTFRYSMESSGYYPELQVQPMDYKYDTFYATTSFDSDVPLPYFSWAEYNIHQPSINYTNAIRGASFIAKNCNSNNDRESVVRNLTKQQQLRVDSLSMCLHNAEPPNGLDMSDKMKLQQQYLFHLAFENTCEVDYITEKLWGTLQSGTLPVYYGAPNVKDHAPPHSIISWHDFNDTIKLGEYLIKVASNQTLYESYHTWRTKPFATSFERKYNFTHIHSICRLCRWGYAKTYGWGWDPITQSVQELRQGTRFPCISASTELLVHPVYERWFSNTEEILKANTAVDDKEEEQFTCLSSENQTQHSSTTMNVGTWKRTIDYHDNVIDVTIYGTGERYGIFQLELPLQNGTLKKITDQMYLYQNTTSRIHVWIGWTMPTVEIHSPNILDITVDQTTTPMRIRILPEDVDTFHKGAAEETSYFASIMKKDFTTPVEYFLIQQEEEKRESSPSADTGPEEDGNAQKQRREG